MELKSFLAHFILIAERNIILFHILSFENFIMKTVHTVTSFKVFFKLSFFSLIFSSKQLKTSHVFSNKMHEKFICIAKLDVL